MYNRIFAAIISTFFVLLINTVGISAQRASVSGKEVTGTFTYEFKGKYKGNTSVIMIQALGSGKVKLGFDLLYPYTMGNGELMVNVGQDVVEAEIKGDKAVYLSSEDERKCRITIHFVKSGVINVKQEEEGAGCGFGLNVTASGTYKKTNSAKPDFSQITQ